MGRRGAPLYTNGRARNSNLSWRVKFRNVLDAPPDVLRHGSNVVRGELCISNPGGYGDADVTIASVRKYGR